MTSPPGTSRDNPLYFRFLRDDEDRLDPKKIFVMLAITALSGYLATQAQRAGSSPDQAKMIRMRYHVTLIRFSQDQIKFWRDVRRRHIDLYEIARL